jgi:hypothetical protein
VIGCIIPFNSCKKESTLLAEQEDISLAKVQKKKKITISKGTSPGFYNWVVECTDKESNITYHSGIEYGRKEAKKKAKEIVCSTGNSSGSNYITIRLEDSQELILGNINAFVVDGFMEYLEEVNPWTNEYHRLTNDEISANALAWLSEVCLYDETLSLEHELVAAQLKVWDIYFGGNSKDEIMSLHNLTPAHFEAIATKS